MTHDEKYLRLREYIKSLGSVAIAFSGGVDSTLLLKVAREVLGNKAVAITARAYSFPVKDANEARAFCESENIKHVICEIDQLGIDGFKYNPEDRCYRCKKELFNNLISAAKKEGIENVAEGSHLDDDGDYRPGRAAIAELKILSPYRFAEMNKNDIRAIAKELGLVSWDKPASCCLVTRFPYGEELTEEKIDMVRGAERVLYDLGFGRARVRYHGDVARIECGEDGFKMLSDKKIREKIHGAFKKIGFTYAATDILGYRTGSMNETLGS